jgi:lipid-A-disaccharide synthase
MKFFVISGESSGDKLGAEIFKEIRNKLPDITLIGVGGDALDRLAIKKIFPQQDINLMGFIEVVPSLFRVLSRINLTVREILKEEPDIIVTIDAPDFNFRVIKKLKKLGYNKSKFIHIVAPTVWAYREYRAQKISLLYDKLLVLLPFEPKYFLKYGLDTKFIGHPLLDKKNIISANILKKYNLAKSDKFIVVTLGSRKQEITRFLPVILESLTLLYNNDIDAKIIFPLANRFNNLILKYKANIKQEFHIVNSENEKNYFYKNAYIAIAKSGTNNLEIATFSVPIITYYAVNYVTYFILKLMVKSKYVNLINIMANKEIIPELIQNKFSAENILIKVKDIWRNKKLRELQIKEQDLYLKKFKAKKGNSAEMAAAEILKLI